MPFTPKNQLGRIPDQLPANSQLQTRVSKTDKVKWATAAKKAGARSLAQWVIARLNAAAKKEKV